MIERQFSARMCEIIYELQTRPKTKQDLHYVWNMLQILRAELTKEFQETCKYSIYDYFINFQNGDIKYSKKFKTYVRRVAHINDYKKIVLNLIKG